MFLFYFVSRGFTDLMGFFTLGTREENLWLGIAGDNSLTMLILGLFSIFILIFAIVLYVSNVKDALFTSRQVQQGEELAFYVVIVFESVVSTGGVEDPVSDVDHIQESAEFF